MTGFNKRLFWLISCFVFEVFWMFSLYWWFRDYAAPITIISTIVSLALVLFIATLRQENAYKTLWIIIILSFPWIGAITYLLFGNKRTVTPLKRHLDASQKSVANYIKKHKLSGYYNTPDSKINIPNHPRISESFDYISHLSNFSIHSASETSYYGTGEPAWKQMLIDLRKAEKFIYVEYFIIGKGIMWNSVVDIMAEKVKEGVDCRVLLDDVGSFRFYSSDNVAELQSLGIKCERFNPVVIVHGVSNYRDHRKILNIDGQVAYSGGINMADEYINRKERFGEWKDNCYRITGAPVKNFTRMYIEFWNAFSKDKIPLDILKIEPKTTSAKGLTLSYYDSPLDNREISNHMYIDLLSQATESAWFSTPYLLLGDALLDAFIRAAKRGIDVKIFMPSIPDKKYIYRMSQSYFEQLRSTGVKIYYYEPGFLHTKAAIIDNKIAVAGSVNLDYRSLFLSFENNSVFYDCEVVSELAEDMQGILKKSREITREDYPHGFISKIHNSVIRLIAPLC